MALTLAFDVYGTLIDTQGVLLRLQHIVGDRAKEFSVYWRSKQLEYSFRRGLMRRYRDFTVCTSHALDFTCAYFDVSLTDDQKLELLHEYRALPAFDDVKVALSQLNSLQYTLCAFSNGTTKTVVDLLKNADLYNLFKFIVSADDVQTFKPNPEVYEHLLATLNANASDVWLISSNAFDIIGAKSAGLQTAWLQRTDSEVFDPWEFQPDITISSLTQLAGCLCDYQTD